MQPIKFKHPRLKWRIAIPARYTDTGRRKVEYFSTREAAESRIKQIQLDGRHALNGKRPLSPHFKSLAETAFAELGNDPAAIIEAIRRYKTSVLTLDHCTVREAVEQFQAFRETRVDKSTLAADAYRLAKLLYRFRAVRLADVSELDLRHFFDGVPNARSVYKSCSVFFNWAKRYKKIAVNPISDIDPPGEYGVNDEVYSPAVFRKMLRIVAGLDAPRGGGEPTRKYAALLPMLVVGGFCGLRPSEIIRTYRNSDAVKTTDVHDKYIEVRAGVAKKTRRGSTRRFVNDPRAIEAFNAWKPHFPDPSKGGFLCPYAARIIKDLKADFSRATKLRFLDNALRNSFCSYLLSFQDVSYGTLAKLAGNSESVLKKHYVEVLPPESGEDWFSIRPASN